MATPISTRRVRLFFFYAVCLLPVIAFGAQRILATNHNSPFEWVPASFAPRQDYEDFRHSFGSGEVLIISWPGCTVDSADLDLLAKSLRRFDLFSSPSGEGYIEQVVTGQEALRGLMAEPLLLTRQQALTRLRGTLVGPDGQTTTAVVTFTPAGLRHRREVVALIRRGLAESCHAPLAMQHFAGPVIDGLSVDEASNDSLNRFAVPSALVVFLVCWWWLRWLPGALLVTGVSLYCEAATLALIYWCGGEMTALLIVLPPLMQVVTASGGIHLINYYLIAAKDYDAETAAWGAVKIGWLPCSLSALTTAIGLASLCVSQLVPVRMFGVYGAAGVLMTFSAVTTFIPGVLSIWKPKGIQRAVSVNLDTGVFEGSNRFWTWFSRQVAKHHTAIIAASLVAMVALGWGIRGLGTSVHVRTLFADDSRIVSDYSWIEQHVGALVPLEVVVEFGPQCALSQADRYSLVGRIQRELNAVEHVRGTVSCANLMPDLSDIQQTDPGQMSRMLEAILKEARPYFAAHRYLHESDARQQWRVTAYTSALEEIDYGEMLTTIDRRLTHANGASRLAVGVSLHVTGVMPLVHQIQRALMQDLFVSFLSAFAMIFVIMTILQAGVWTAVISMVPNAFPTLVLFGLLGWLRWPLDIGSVMTASVALGIAVDDVLHFLTFYRRGLARGLTREEAVHATLQQCGFAMFLSSLVCGLGPIVFYMSDFLPASRFAWMMLVLLTVAVAGDMILLPALVVGPLGRLFERQYGEPTNSTDVSHFGRNGATHFSSRQTGTLTAESRH
jgi:predicted RND superfamily exporter protein